MSFRKNRRPQMMTGGFAIASTIQTLTAASTATTITNDGITTIASGTAASKTFKLAKPDRKGQVKRIIANMGTTGDVVVLAGPSTAYTFSGSTLGKVTFSTGAGRYRSIELIGVSTAAWIISGRSTGVTPAA